tara:strand:+ start:2438 stop:2677 length:240 start_codon:yes stop_codon:yes gene_type:complete
MEENTKGLEKIRAFIDLEVNGEAKGGIFIKSDLKDKIEELEKPGELRVVGVVYDGTYNLEIITKPVGEAPKFKIKGKKR